MKKLHVLFAVGILAVALPVAAHDGEDHGTIGQDTGIGVGLELQSETSVENHGAEQSAESRTEAELRAEARGEASAQQHNESDLGFLNTRASEDGLVSVQAREIRGMDAEARAEFLTTVKSHAEVQSGQELENFAKGILAADGNVEAVSSTETQVEVRYRVPAKFLGIFETTLPATITVEAAGEGSANASVSERVKAKFPWLRVFYTVPEDVRATALEQAVEAELQSEIEAQTQFETSAQARLFQLISNVLKVRHETSMNIMQNMR